MADKHVLQGADDGYSVTVAFHIPIPDATNEDAQNYRDLIAAHEDTQSQVPDITQAEQDQLDTGELVEEIRSVEIDTGANSQDHNQAVIDDLYTQATNEVQTRLENRYKYYGVSW